MKKCIVVLFGAMIMLGLSLIGCEQNPSGETGKTGVATRHAYPVVQDIMDKGVEDSLDLLATYRTRNGYTDPRLGIFENALQTLHSSSAITRSVGGDFFDTITEEQDAEIEALLEENPELLYEFISITENLEEEISNLPEIEVEIQDYDEEGNLIGEPYTIVSENGHLDLGMDVVSVAEYVNQAQKLEHKDTRGFAAQYGYSRVRYWKNNTVEFFFDKSLSNSDKRWMRTRLAAITKATGITFKELKNTGWRRFRHATGAQWVKIKKANLPTGIAGQATLGRKSWATLTMDTDSAQYQPTFDHEVGHVLGLLHEHQRPDRDSYITVTAPSRLSSAARRTNYDKIPYTRVTGWRQIWQRTVRVSTTYGTPFDYASLMSYQKLPSRVNTKRGTNRFNNKERWESVNGGTYYTPWDMYTVKRMYGIKVDKPTYTPYPELLEQKKAR